jgi:hypothetical protein
MHFIRKLLSAVCAMYNFVVQRMFADKDSQALLDVPTTATTVGAALFLLAMGSPKSDFPPVVAEDELLQPTARGL